MCTGERTTHTLDLSPLSYTNNICKIPNMWFVKHKNYFVNQTSQVDAKWCDKEIGWISLSQEQFRYHWKQGIGLWLQVIIRVCVGEVCQSILSSCGWVGTHHIYCKYSSGSTTQYRMHYQPIHARQQHDSECKLMIDPNNLEIASLGRITGTWMTISMGRSIMWLPRWGREYIYWSIQIL